MLLYIKCCKFQFVLLSCNISFLNSSWYDKEVQESKVLNEYLGAGIGIFQGLSNFAINGMTLIVLYCGGALLDSKQITPGDLMSFLMATQTIQRLIIFISSQILC